MSKQIHKVPTRISLAQSREIDTLNFAFPEKRFPEIMRKQLLLALPIFEAKPEYLTCAIEAVGNGFTEPLDVCLDDDMKRWVARVARKWNRSIADVIRAAEHMEAPLLLANPHLVDIVSSRQYQWVEESNPAK